MVKDGVVTIPKLNPPIPDIALPLNMFVRAKSALHAAASDLSQSPCHR
jgi:hypothetical protein